jgi:Na+-transporting methylmalonyl-CoA/oxaloacetate decarboxylase gamma subunit
MLKRLLKKTLKTIGMLILLIAVIIVAAVVNKPTEQEKKQKEAKELADKKLDELRNACDAYVRKSVINKSTLDMSAFGSNRWLGNDGKFYATQEFSAKNKFGLEQKFRAECIEDKNGKTDYRLVEMNGS